MRNCLVIDLDRCSGCDSCVAACKHENGVALGVYYNHVKTVGPVGEWPRIEQYWLPTQCQQCENAPCVEVCPTGASYRDDEYGLVLIDAETCIGCQLCMSACPFGARCYDEDQNIVVKCTCCIQRLKEGEKPACVHNCCCGARLFGDLDDPDSDVSKALAAADPDALHQLNDTVGAEPRTVYILSAKTAAWQDDVEL
jgi:Fe-S-cluster-containing dehydrogenase component